MAACLDAAAGDDARWQCIRGAVVGSLAVPTLAAGAYGAARATASYARSRTHGLNVALLWLVAAQTAVDAVGHLLVRDDRLRVASLLLRAGEQNLCCAAYASFALDARGRADLMRTRVAPPALAFLAFQATLAALALATEDDTIDCSHPLWLVFSVSTLALSVVFVAVGALALREVRRIAERTRPYLGAGAAPAPELRRRRRELWACLVVFLASSVATVAGDAWRQDAHRNGRSCVVHETDAEEAARLVLDLVSLLPPPWAIIAVFFVEVRWAFAKTHDIALEEVGGDDAAEQPLRGGLESVPAFGALHEFELGVEPLEGRDAVSDGQDLGEVGG